jgi:hypothetical protein
MKSDLIKTCVISTLIAVAMLGTGALLFHWESVSQSFLETEIKSARGDYSLLTPTGIVRPGDELDLAKIEWQPSPLYPKNLIPFIGEAIVLNAREGDFMGEYSPHSHEGVSMTTSSYYGNKYPAYIPEKFRAAYKKMKGDMAIVMRSPYP